MEFLSGMALMIRNMFLMNQPVEMLPRWGKGLFKVRQQQPSFSFGRWLGTIIEDTCRPQTKPGGLRYTLIWK
jgi:hypothetical protein